MKRVFFSAAALLIAASLWSAETPKEKTYGKAPTVKEPTEISVLNSEPTKYVDKVVLLTGIVTEVCQGVGCWVEVQAADSARVICRSLDESIHFPKNVVGKTILVQGKVMWDPKASGKAEMKEEGGTPHACPNPKLMVSLEGATVAELTTPAAAPKEDVKAE